MSQTKPQFHYLFHPAENVNAIELYPKQGISLSHSFYHPEGNFRDFIFIYK